MGGGGVDGRWRRGGERSRASVVVMAVAGLVLCGAPLALSFNLEPRAANLYSYPYSDTQGREAYFGYAVALQHSAEDSASWVVIGAPRANSSHHDEDDIPEPGAVFTCPFTPDEDTACEELNIDPTGNEVNTSVSDRRKEYKDLKNHGWLGGSLDSQPGYRHNRQATCVCAPLWKDQYNASEVHVNGACYWTHRRLSDAAAFRKELPLLDIRQQIKKTTYYNAYGEAGFSIHFPNDSRKMIFGAPGAVNWTGKLIIFEDYEKTSVDQERKKRQVERVKAMFDDVYEVASKMVQTDELLGYAVTSGKFLDSHEELYATGAPRSADSYGKVVLFRFADYEYEETFPRELKGQQMGEYFGAALTAGDINGDGLTDLVVGSPMYSRPSHPDVGRIHVFLSEEGLGLSNGPQHCYGRRGSMSRFGLTLAAADLNMDNYQDVVVGAPWEEGTGAVYIFQGSAEGLRQPHSQRLSPENFTPGLRGFGMALSRGIDVDQNGYPDFAIGSILSDKVVLVRSRPVAVLSARVIASPRIVPFEEETPVTLRTCIHCGGYKLPRGLVRPRVKANLTLDYRSQTPRAVLAGGKNTSLIFVEELVPNEEVCWEHQVIVQEEKTNPDDDITMRLEYVLLDSPSLPLVEQPVTDPKAANSEETEVSIAKGCERKVCRVDMWTQAAFVDGNNSSVVIGKTNKLQVTVYNRGEHVYFPNMTVSVDPPLVVIPPSTHECSFLDATHKSKMVCKLANRIKNTSEPESVVVDVKVDKWQMNKSSSLTHLEVYVTGVGEEQNPDDNTVSLSLQLATQAELELHGSSLEEQVAYEHKEKDLIVVKSNLKFNHTYILIKKGPTPLKTIDLVLDIPTSFSDGQEFVKVKLGETKFSSHLNCSWSRGFNVTGSTGKVVSAPLNMSANGSVGGDGGGGGGGGGGPSSQDDKVVQALKGTEVGTQYFNCSSDVITCAQLFCRLDRWQADSESARVTVELELDLAVLASRISVAGGAVLGSSGTATIQGLNPQLVFIGKREVTGHTVTNIQPESLMGRGVPWWVILLAILVGLLLLGLLAYGLYKKGFFKRKKMEEMRAHRAEMHRSPTSFSNPNAVGN